MTLEQVYSDVAAHMVEGLMVHEHLANYYDFLGLGGYKRCHEYYYLKECIEYRRLCRYYINHHNKLIPEKRVNNPEIIPEGWYNHVRQDVDTSTKKEAVRTGLTKWVEWEAKTKRFYETMYKELMDLGEVASACKIKELVLCADKELKKAQRYWLNKEAVGYNMASIISEQKCYHDKYKKKIKKEWSIHLC